MVLYLLLHIVCSHICFHLHKPPTWTWILLIIRVFKLWFCELWMKLIFDPEVIKFLFSNSTFFPATSSRSCQRSSGRSTRRCTASLTRSTSSCTKSSSRSLRRRPRSKTSWRGRRGVAASLRYTIMSRIAYFLLHIRVGANPRSLMTSEPNECSFPPLPPWTRFCDYSVWSRCDRSAP